MNNFTTTWESNKERARERENAKDCRSECACNHPEEEVQADRNHDVEHQEREDTIRIKSVASTCRSLGRRPPVLGMVALRGVLAVSAPWALVGSRVAALGGATRSVSESS